MIARTDAAVKVVAAAGLVTAQLSGEPVGRLAVAVRDGSLEPFETPAAPASTPATYVNAVSRALAARAAPDAPVRVRLDGAEEALGAAVVIDVDAGGRLAVNATQHAASSLVRLLEQAVDALAMRAGTLEDLDLVGHLWRSEIIALGRPPEPPPPAGTLGQGFAAVAARVPDHVAVTDAGTAWTYAELDAYASRIVRRLRDLEVRAGDRVGLCAGRSVHTVAGLVAVVRVGATYVPMDPTYPTERLAFLVADAGLGVVLATAQCAASVPAGPRVLELSDDRDSGGEDADLPVMPDEAEPDSVAYVIYTSGSSGTPKGVLVRHRNVLSLLAGTESEFGLGPSDVWSWFHSESFDFSVWEIWGCLLTGGRLVVVPSMTCRDPAEFLQLLHREGVTVLSQTPSAFASLLELDQNKLAEAPARLVVLGGEALDARLLAPWFELHPPPHCRVVNMFGITETTVHATAQDVDEEMVAAGSHCVGRPLPGWTVRVVDRGRRLLPPGLRGEIVVGGAGVAAGYLGRHDLTTERFGIDEDGTPLYASGDLGRLLADGRLEHLGRMDGQIKLRGYRIEPDEIRAVLLREPSVAAAAVVLRLGRDGDIATATLHAFVVPAAGENPPETSALRAAVARTLPAHMVPSGVTMVSGLPLTVNGKLDTRALVAVVAESTTVASPCSPGEEVLIAAWTDVFGAEPDLDANFFDAGGTSLAAARLVATLAERGRELAVRQVYRAATVRDLARIIGFGSPSAR